MANNPVKTLLNLIEWGNEDADVLSEIVEQLTPVPPRGTIVKADADQDRFKPDSLWVSNGDGTYLHLTGSKGLTAKHNRLAGFTHTIFTL